MLHIEARIQALSSGEPLVRATRPPSMVSNHMQAGGIWLWVAFSDLAGHPGV